MDSNCHQLRELQKEKKHFLTEFMNLNSKALIDLRNGNFHGVEELYNQREQVLEILKFIDEKISSINSYKKETNSYGRLEVTMDSPLNENSEIIQKILNQDREILILIDSTKTSIISEIQSLKKNKKCVSHYKTKVDHHQFDEEA